MSAARYRDLWRENRAFRPFFLGIIVSFLGDWFSTVALYTAAQELGHGGMAITLVMVFQTLPVFLAVPVVGPIVDRFDRRSLLLFANLVRCGLALLLIWAYVARSLWALFAIVIAMAALSSLGQACTSAILPRIVAQKYYAAANALGGASWAAMLTLGAALGGLTTASVGVRMSFGIDALTFLVSTVCFARLSRMPPQGNRAPSSRDASFVSALRYLVQKPRVLALALLKPCLNLVGAVVPLTQLFGTVVYAGAKGPAWVGILLSSRGLGTLVGSLAVRVLLGDRPQRMRPAIVAAFAGLMLSLYWLSVAGNFWESAIVHFAIGLLFGMVFVFSTTLLQIEADPLFHGRVFAIDYGLLTGTMAGSSFLAGALIDTGYSAPEVTGFLIVLPIAGILAGLYVWWSARGDSTRS